MDDLLDDLWSVVKSIPKGSVATYGDVGRALPRPATGRMVGRWMAQCPSDVPWWRVVAASGNLPIGKRDPFLEREQTEILREEGVAVDGRRVEMSGHRYIP